jgi:myo-inositol-1(or 4)-monophosphatase
MGRQDDLDRIASALAAAGRVVEAFTPGEVDHRRKAGGDPVTEADLAINQVLHERLPQPGEGWLSEETADAPERLSCSRVWVVDPLDGTREFVAGIPEWCISVGLVEDGRAVAGGVLIPSRSQVIVGSRETGVQLNGEPRRTRDLTSLEGVEVLASRSEVGRGEWGVFDDAPFQVKPTGSVALKLALVAAGEADVTWTLVPKHEWDVAAGVALIAAGGGSAWIPGRDEPSFNNERPKLPGLIAAPEALEGPIRELLRTRVESQLDPLR